MDFHHLSFAALYVTDGIMIYLMAYLMSMVISEIQGPIAIRRTLFGGDGAHPSPYALSPSKGDRSPLLVSHYFLVKPPCPFGTPPCMKILIFATSPQEIIMKRKYLKSIL